MRPLPRWVNRSLYPFTPHVLEQGGHRIHYVDEGRGPLLLLLHGNPTWSFVWRDVIGRLSDRFRCIAPDLPGFGLSETPPGFDGRPESIADVLSGFVQHLDLWDVILVAQDWGGPIGLSLVERMPDRFTGLVLANTWAWPVTGDRHFEQFSTLMGGPIGAWLARRVNLVVNTMIPAGHRRRRLWPDEMRHYRKPLSTPQRRQASAVLPREIVHSAPFLARVESGLPALRSSPALLIWAGKDIAFREKELDRWIRELPDATVARIPDAGHFLPSDAPAEFADAIGNWHRDVLPGPEIATETDG